jgi:ferric-dicitrate binding protein FerR (iron transport regulator)
VLHDLLGLPTAEIATLMRLSLAATQSRLVRAHKELTLALLAEGWLAEPPQPSIATRGRAQPVPGKAPDLEDLFSAWRAEARAHSRASSIGRGGSRAVAHALQLVARRRRRARRLNTLGLVAVALITLLGVAFGIWFAQRRLSGDAERLVAEPRVLLGGVLGDVSVSDRDGHAIHGFASLGEGYALRTDDGRARLGFSSGAAVSVTQHSRLVLLSAQDTEVFYLGSGTAEIDLPDLALGGSFAVETPDTHVTSHAAQFVVGVEPEGGASPTRVTVQTGRVSLRSGGRQIELDAGQSWPAASPSAAGTDDLEAEDAPGLDLTLPELAPSGSAPADFTGK